MRKIKIRCFKTFERVNSNTYNFPVYNMIYEGWSKNSLATCIECGELFVIDFENPKFDNLNLIEIVGNTFCPKCNSKLKDTIKEYPKHIKLVNGEIGSFVSNQFIPNDNETIIAEFYEI